MKRDPAALTGRSWDVLVVGGGIHGAFIAREAALRGLSTALVDKGDFASATSSHSQKIVHNGLRYLQHGDLARLRQSVRERSALMKIAPHLVRLLPVLVPTYGHGRRGPGMFALGMALHDIMGLDRNRGLTAARRIPRGKIIGPAECRKIFPEVEERGLSGGAIWYDGQVTNTERFILQLLHDLCAAGGRAANYLQVTGFLKEGGRLAGVTARDVLEGDEFTIRARLTVNATGPWLGETCRLAGAVPPEPTALSRAMVLVVDRPLVKDFAVGLPDRSAFHDPDVLVGRSERFFFITPWKGRALVGSAHLPFEGPADDCRVSEEEISAFLDAVNAACPPWALRRADVSFVYRGLLPTAGFDPASGCVQVEKKQKILDHGSAGGPDGLVSVLGVKYTTARDAAVRTVELAGRKLGIPSPVDAGTFTPVGGAAGRTPPGDLKLSADGAGRKVGKEILRHLHDTYGPAWGEVLRLIDEDPRLGEPIDPAAEEVAAEIAYGVREEMASKLSDLVLRRTGLGNMGHPGRTALERCADLAARELGWDEKRRSAEIEEVESIYRST